MRPSGNVYIPVPDTNVTWSDGDPVDPTTGISTFVTGPGFGQTTPIYQTVVDDKGTIIEVKVLNILRFDEKSLKGERSIFL